VVKPMQRTVCVTGANGYVATQIVKDLLQKGYKVVGTVRALAKTEGYSHLKDLPNAATNLEIREADIESDESLKKAFAGCYAVLHTASPFFFPPADKAEELLLKPAVNGALSALKAAVSIGIKKVILTSSIAATNGSQRTANPNHVFTEADWNDGTVINYAYSKTAAEKAAWEFVKNHAELNLVVVNPAFVLGPVYTASQASSTSVKYMLKFLDGTVKEGNKQNNLGMIDVRVVSQAHIAALEKAEAKGRYLTANTSQISDLQTAQILAKHFPSFNVPTTMKQGEEYKPPVAAHVDHSKAEKELGLQFIDYETTVVDMAKSLISYGYVHKE